jgi:hypothetical protein
MRVEQDMVLEPLHTPLNAFDFILAETAGLALAPCCMQLACSMHTACRDYGHRPA